MLIILDWVLLLNEALGPLLLVPWSWRGPWERGCRLAFSPSLVTDYWLCGKAKQL